MRTIEEIVAALQLPGIPRNAQVSLRYSNGVARQEQLTSLTLRELQALAAALIPTPRSTIAEPSAESRSDDRRESDRHPPRPL